MESELVKLPGHQALDIKAFSKIFESTQNSYKFLLFGFLLHEVPRRPAQRLFFDSSELVNGMLEVAKFPVLKCHLSLGRRDRVPEVLHELSRSKNCDVDLLDWVPYRLIRPFFAQALARRPDQVINSEIQDLAEAQFRKPSPPLYRICSQDNCISGIEVHPSWQSYLVEHFDIVDAWRKWHWADYLQRRNPHALNINQKLVRPSRQTQELNKLRELWREISESETGEIKCSFTGESLHANQIVVDHFLPWSYVGHNQKWNLCPTTQPTNTRKSDKLPSDLYIQNLVDVQLLTLNWVKKTRRKNDWETFIEDYQATLRVAEEDLLNRSKLEKAIKTSIQPHYQLAKNMGFDCGWIHKSQQ